MRLQSPKGRDDTGYFGYDGMPETQGIMYSSHWWKSRTGYCGFNIPEGQVSISTFGEEDPIWAYDAPRGGEDDAFRINDWINYNNDIGFNELLISTPKKIYPNSVIAVGVGWGNSSEYALGYNDIFDTSLYGVNQECGLYLSAYTIAQRYVQSKRIDLDPSHNNRINFDFAEIGNPTTGQEVIFHLYAKGLRGELKSARFSADTQTVWTATVASSEKYSLSIKCQVILRTPENMGNIEIRDLACNINAIDMVGGTVQASTFKVQTKRSGYWYDEAYFNLPSVSVGSGEYKDLAPWGNPYTLYVGDIDSEQVKFVWSIRGLNPIERTMPILKWGGGEIV